MKLGFIYLPNAHTLGILMGGAGLGGLRAQSEDFQVLEERGTCNAVRERDGERLAVRVQNGLLPHNITPPTKR